MKGNQPTITVKTRIIITIAAVLFTVSAYSQDITVFDIPKGVPLYKDTTDFNTVYTTKTQSKVSVIDFNKDVKKYYRTLNGMYIHTYYLTSAEYKKLSSISVAVSGGKIYVGMSKTAFEKVFIAPKEVNTDTYSFGVHEQWIYDDGYIYFENDKLTTIQQRQ